MKIIKNAMPESCATLAEEPCTSAPVGASLQQANAFTNATQALVTHAPLALRSRFGSRMQSGIRQLQLSVPAAAIALALAQPATAGIEGSAAAKADDLAPVQTRIIGGRSADDGAWPSAVALVRTTNQSLFLRQFCGANLINSRWAITAAHCLYDGFGELIEPSTVGVAMGFTDLANESQADGIVITNLYVHPLYDNSDPSAPHDIALVELASAADQPHMKLYDGDAEDIAGQQAVAVGWGANSYSAANQPLFPSKLNEVSIPLVGMDVCNSPQSYDGLLGVGQVCAGFQQGGKDSCLGDSGGPLMTLQGGDYRQIGLVSFGRGCAEANFYGVYTRLEFYKTWISEITGISDYENPDSTNGTSLAGGSTSPQGPAITVTSSDNKPSSGGTGSIGAVLPLMMLLIALMVWRRGGTENLVDDIEASKESS